MYNLQIAWFDATVLLAEMSLKAQGLDQFTTQAWQQSLDPLKDDFVQGRQNSYQLSGALPSYTQPAMSHSHNGSL